MKNYTEATKTKVLAMRAKGMAYKDIQKKTGVSIPTIFNWKRAHESKINGFKRDAAKKRYTLETPVKNDGIRAAANQLVQAYINFANCLVARQ